MHRVLVLMLALVVCAVGAPAGALAGEPVEECGAVHRAVLACGLEVVVYEQADEVMAPEPVQVWTRVHRGSMSERDEERGAAMVASRAVMGGVEPFTAEDMLGFFGLEDSQRFGGRGAIVVGDHVAFMCSVESGDRVGKGLMVARGLLDGFAPSDESIGAAREAVLGELADDSAKGVERRMYSEWLPALLRGSAYGRLAMPTVEQCSSLSDEAVRGYVAREWVARQVSVLVVGDVDAEEVFAEARRVFDGCDGGVVTAESVGPVVEEGLSGNVVSMHEARLSGTRLGLVWFGDRRERVWDREDFDEVLVEALAGEAMRYRMNRMLRKEFESVAGARVDIGDLAGRIAFGQMVVDLQERGEGMDEDGWAQVLGAMEVERRRLVRDGFTDAEITRAREWVLQQWGYEIDQWRGGTTRERARSLSWMLAIGRPLVEFEDWIGSAGDWLGGVEKARVDGVIAGLFGGSDPAVLVLLDSEEGVDESVVRRVLAEARRVEPGVLAWDWIKQLHGPILDRSGGGGEVEELSVHQASGVVSATLSNGVVVHHREMTDGSDPEGVTVCVRVGFDSIEDASMHGAGDVMAMAMERGMIRSRTEEEIRAILIENGISMEVSRGVWGLELMLRVSGGDGGTGEGAFERAVELVQALLTDLRIEQGVVDELASEGASGARAIGVPVGAMEAGIGEAMGVGYAMRDPAEVGDALDARSVRAWIGSQVRGGLIEVGIAGAIGPERAIEACARYLGGISEGEGGGESTLVVDAARAGVEGERAVRVEDPSGRGGVMVGFAGCRVEDLDELRALTVAGMVLEGRLDRSVEEIEEGTRSMAGAMTLDLVPGRVVMFGRVECGAGAIDAWAGVVLDEIERMALEGVSAADMEGPMARIDGMLVEGMGESRFWARRLSVLGERGWDVDAVWSIRRAYAGLDAPSVSSAFRKWYRDGEHFRVEMIDAAR